MRPGPRSALIDAPAGPGLPHHCRVRHDNPEAIIAASAAFVQFCREQGLVGGRVVAVDGTKMRAVAGPKNIAGAERLARDIAHTEKEIAY